MKSKRKLAAVLVVGASLIPLSLTIGGSAVASTAHNASKGGTSVKTVAYNDPFRPGLRLSALKTWKGKRVNHYQWARCNAKGKACANIRHATKRSYVITKRDIGHTLVVRMTVQSVIVQSNPTAVIVAAATPPPVNQTVPVITDNNNNPSVKVQVGDVLTGTMGTWTGATSYSWVWQDCDASGNNCVTSTTGSSGTSNDPSATGTYNVTSADLGHTIRFVVTASNTTT